jgi:hypothetical protein
MLDDCHAATEATICLCHFEADIAAAKDDQMLRHIVEFQSLDVRKWSGRIEARYARNGRVCSNIEENLIARQHARPAVVQVHLERFRRHEIPCSHDQFRTARFVQVKMPRDLPIDHLALALQHSLHVDGGGICYRSEPTGLADQIGDLRAPDFVLARQAVGVGAGTANKLALNDSGSLARLGYVPGQIFAAFSTSKDKGFKPFRLSHGYVLSRVTSSCLVEVRPSVHPASANRLMQQREPHPS